MRLTAGDVFHIIEELKLPKDQSKNSMEAIVYKILDEYEMAE